MYANGIDDIHFDLDESSDSDDEDYEVDVQSLRHNYLKANERQHIYEV